MFRTAFGDGLAWSRDLHHIAVYQTRLREVMEHWTETLSSQPLHVRYEDLVSDPESELRRITDWLQLDWDPAVLEQHHSTRLVTTASHTQVRDALHRGYVGRSEPYRPYLKALED